MGMTARLGIGFNQSYKDMIGSRVSGVTYYNNTGRPMFVYVAMSGGSSSTLLGYVNDLNVSAQNSSFATQGIIYMIVPPGASYKATAGLAIQSWFELSA